ncbi:MAG: ATP-binding cassette domain-containing protein [Verrucomicrobia bacterium]|nr:MAG: ATP-binding cassette domain-containing protein [Verrucomicrobiota bacterium]TAE88863.1 MAG: ATP-binding cassette domain-containing protein [Verrucomicrobiota bacterium]TAF27280.1 MAG: ATP-binding cassette domain-containing protein [Verrucomicrobiota bacterium]TAF42429.1 MAG: ATP-binding cassette domain-containing protein [Verrucomicrobiota bacterium]
MSMKTQLPQIKLQAGLAIGYRQAIASLPEDIFLPGGTHFLIARNGRGKTTLLRTLAKTLKQVAGSFVTEGKTQYLSEDLRFDPHMSVDGIFRAIVPAARQEAARQLAKTTELDLRKSYGQLSTGNRRKTHLIVAEQAIAPDRANILLLDEPFSGLDAYSREVFEQLWHNSPDQVLRLVSCHPDYDSMGMPSTLVIQGNEIRHSTGPQQIWSQLKGQLN